MDMSTLIWPFAIASLVIVFVGWAAYIATIPGDRVPRKPIFMFATQFTGVGLAIGTFLVGSQTVVPVGAMIVSGFAIFIASSFLILFSQRKTPLGNIQVEVGKPMLAFRGTDSEGNTVNSDDWRGHKILFKFFRGHW